MTKEPNALDTESQGIRIWQANLQRTEGGPQQRHKVGCLHLRHGRPLLHAWQALLNSTPWLSTRLWIHHIPRHLSQLGLLVQQLQLQGVLAWVTPERAWCMGVLSPAESDLAEHASTARSQERALRSAPAQNTPGVELRTTTQRVLRSWFSIRSASPSSRSSCRPAVAHCLLSVYSHTCASESTHPAKRSISTQQQSHGLT